MASLTLMSVGGVIPFLKGPELDRAKAPKLIVLTLLGSVIGAMLVFEVPAAWLPRIIPFAMLFMLAFLLMNPRMGSGITPHTEAAVTSGRRIRAGYFAMFLLAIYGGFFSGGYVTLLIAACVFFFRYSFLRAIVMARLMNVGSSLIATSIFAWHGAIDWKLAGITGAAAFAGGIAGAGLAGRISERLLRFVFMGAVAVLALTSLLSIER